MYVGNFFGIEKIRIVIKDFFFKVIEEIGFLNVFLVVTDNALNCKVVGKEIEKVYKYIFWFLCVVYILNLIFKDFVRIFNWLSSIYKSGKEIVKYFKNY